jgi:hypothetical protein
MNDPFIDRLTNERGWRWTALRFLIVVGPVLLFAVALAGVF